MGSCWASPAETPAGPASTGRRLQRAAGARGVQQLGEGVLLAAGDAYGDLSVSRYES